MTRRSLFVTSTNLTPKRFSLLVLISIPLPSQEISLDIVAKKKQTLGPMIYKPKIKLPRLQPFFLNSLFFIFPCTMRSLRTIQYYKPKGVYTDASEVFALPNMMRPEDRT